MANSTTTLNTPHASRYLQQLCKHFGHKVPVDFTPTEGLVDLPFGQCQLNAYPDHLNVTVAGDDAAIGRLEQFVGDHLIRFAFRENPSLSWEQSNQHGA